MITYSVRNIFNPDFEVMNEPTYQKGEPLVVKELLIQIFGYFLVMISTTMLLYIGKDPLISLDVSADQSSISPILILIVLQNFLM